VPFDWEALIGVKLFSWVAGVGFALGAVFFLGYSIQNGWLQPPVRMAIGMVAGVGLIIGCELKAARRYPVTSDALAGAGVATLFATSFASYRLWALYGPTVAFALFALVTVVAVLLSVRRDSVYIALLGLLGGFSTPALLATGEDHPFGLFGYLMLLNAGLAWVSYRKRWAVLVALSLAFTTIYQWSWVAMFLSPGRLGTAFAIFLAFPVLALASLGVAGRSATAGPGPRRGSLHEAAASISAALPLLFALFLSAVPEYGDHPALLFGFLLCLDAGLFAVARWRGRPALHVLGAAATLLVFAAWTATAYESAHHQAAYPAVLGFVALFVTFFLGAGLVAARKGRLDTTNRVALYAAPLLLFVFPALAAAEPATSAPALPFGVLFLLVGAVAVVAIVTDTGALHFLAAFLAVAAEATWSVRYLDETRLPAALIIYGLFGLLYLAVPLAARRVGRPLRPPGLSGLLLLLSLGLLFFLSFGQVAASSLWGLALLLAILNVGLLVEERASRRPFLALAGTVVSWLVLGAWWLSRSLATQLAPALLVMAAFTLLTLSGRVWLATDSTGEAEPEGLPLALVGHVFLLFVAAQPVLSVPPWAMLGVLATLDVAFAVAALVLRRAESHLSALAASQCILLVWVITADVRPWPLVGLGASAAVGALGFLWTTAARRRLAAGPALDMFDRAAAAGLVLAQTVLLAASTTSGAPSAGALAGFHLACLAGLFAVAARRNWPALAVVAVVPASVAAPLWHAVHGSSGAWQDVLWLAAPIYLAFVAYPLLLGRRLGRTSAPHAAAIVASASFFHVARVSMLEAGWGEVLGALPVAQAGVTAILLVALLRLERPGQRALGRLALVAGTTLAFITVAIPLQLEKEWLTIGWALEGAALAWLFRRLPHRGLFWAALGLLAVAFARLALNPGVLAYEARGPLPILNWYLYTYLLCAAAMLTAGWMFRPTDDSVGGSLRGSQLAAAGGTILLFLLLNIEIADFYTTGATIAFNLSAGLAQDLTYTLAWAVFAVCLLSAGIVLRSHPARLSAIVLLTVTVLKGFLHDVARLGGLYRVGSFVGLAICLSLVAVVLQKFVLADERGDAGR
jgi:hypothetical protein